MFKAVLLLTFMQLCIAQQLTWPKQYTVKGQIILPSSDIQEPFNATVDMTGRGRSRIDYYGGTTVILNLGNQGDNGTMYKIFPETTKDHVNVMTCVALHGNSEAPVTPQGLLPDISLYKYVADFKYNGMDTEVYMSSYSVGPKNNNYTLLVKKDDKSPVLLRFRGYDRLFGSHYDKYVIEYSYFSTTIDQSVFGYAIDFDCKGPGLGSVALAMSENPMFEFVGADGYEEKHHSFKVDSDFEGFKGQHGRQYETEGEESKRKTHFRHNHRYIHSMNRRNLPYKLKMNHMTDYSDSEFSVMRGHRHSKNSPQGQPFKPHEYFPLPDKMDWRYEGAVTPVKDQGICGSGWSFATTGTIEGSNYIANGVLKSFSEQALIDCTWGYGNNGCDGGDTFSAYQWIMDNECMPTEYSYGGGRYLMQNGYCQVNQSICGAIIDSPIYNIQPGSLKTAIYGYGPISTPIDASHKSFTFYSHGLYYEPQCGNKTENLDHTVLAVGYGVYTVGVPNTDYWFIKNSWSTHWGSEGYMLINRRDSNCGVGVDAWGVKVRPIRRES